jgi:hypothetical protein
LSEKSRTCSGISGRGVRRALDRGNNGATATIRATPTSDLQTPRDEVAGAWEEAFSADRPVVYEAIVDAEVPPMPPHISFDQAKSITRALYRGDPAAPEIIRHSFAELVEEYIPHR